VTVRTGLERLENERAGLVRGARVALLCHAASVDGGLRHAAVGLVERAGARVELLFAPEHGVAAAAQDMVEVGETRDPVTGLPVVSLYGSDETSLAPPSDVLEEVDAVVADLVDVGARYYTFVATLVRTMEVAATVGCRVVVADRPNPIGGAAVEGPRIAEGFFSFVGELPVSNRHGMTIGELARLARAQRCPDLELDIVPLEGWQREQWWDETGLPWVAPSPNMPTLDTAGVYPGACLIEATRLSEGRGTTRPFELVGAPWLDPVDFARRLSGFDLPGVLFRPVEFLPCFQKHAGQPCGGVQIHIRSRSLFRPVLTGVALVAAARAADPGRFAWRREPYEFVADRPAIDLLAGSPRWREAIESGASPWDVEAGWQAEQEAFEQERRALLLYG
jgi:uncharacterized protein YbbC (DUF1343 family)